MSLKDIKFQSQETFAGVEETADNTLYFVEAIPCISAVDDVNTNKVRIFSDKWCEQYGISGNIGSKQSVTITMKQSFTDTSFNVLITAFGSSHGTACPNSVVTAKTQNTFTIYNGGGNTLKFMWEAKGFIS